MIGREIWIYGHSQETSFRVAADDRRQVERRRQESAALVDPQSAPLCSDQHPAIRRKGQGRWAAHSCHKGVGKIGRQGASGLGSYPAAGEKSKPGDHQSKGQFYDFLPFFAGHVLQPDQNVMHFIPPSFFLNRSSAGETILPLPLESMKSQILEKRYAYNRRVVLIAYELEHFWTNIEMLRILFYGIMG